MADAHGVKGTGEKMFDVAVRVRSVIRARRVLGGGEAR